MNFVTSWHQSPTAAALVAAAVVASGVLLGCSAEPEQPGGPKQQSPQEKAAESGAGPEQPAGAAEQPATPGPPAATASSAAQAKSPAARPETSATKTDEPATKPSASAIAAAADAAAGVKVSSFAPAEDLAAQLRNYVDELERTVESEDEFNLVEGKVAKDDNTLIVIALALGMHDQPNPYQAKAASIVKAAQALAAVANDYQAAKKGVVAVKAAVDGAAVGGPLKWEKVAALPELMKQVPLANTKLKRCIPGERFQSKAKDGAGYAAVIGAIAQGSIADPSQAKSDEELRKWQAYCIQMREAAGAVNAAFHASDQAAAAAAVGRLAQSCDDCHAVFHKEAESEKDSAP